MLPEPYIILEKFFFLGEVPANAETGTYVLPFVILSYVIASLGSFAGLRLASEIHNVQTGILKKVLHLVCADYDFLAGPAIHESVCKPDSVYRFRHESLFADLLEQ